MHQCLIRKLAIFFMTLPIGCAATTATHPPQKIINCETEVYRDQTPFKGKIGLFPVRVQMRELGTSQQWEDVPQWSIEAEDIVKNELLEHFGKEKEIEIVPLTELSEEKRRILEQYRELLRVITDNREFIRREIAMEFNPRNAAWNHQKDRTYTLGSGLAGLKQTLGVDAILFVSGYDGKITAARAVSNAATAFLSFLAVGVSLRLPGNYCVLNAGGLELETGKVLWANGVGSRVHSLKNEQHVGQLIDAAFGADTPEEKEQDAHVPAE